MHLRFLAEYSCAGQTFHRRRKQWFLCIYFFFHWSSYHPKFDGKMFVNTFFAKTPFVNPWYCVMFELGCCNLLGFKIIQFSWWREYGQLHDPRFIRLGPGVLPNFRVQGFNTRTHASAVLLKTTVYVSKLKFWKRYILGWAGFRAKGGKLVLSYL